MQRIISSRLAWTAAILLTAINTYSFADRQLPSIMIPELKAELLLTDAQIGFLFGTVFAIFFGIATVIFGKLADTPYRKNVLIFCYYYVERIDRPLWNCSTILGFNNI